MRRIFITVITTLGRRRFILCASFRKSNTGGKIGFYVAYASYVTHACTQQKENRDAAAVNLGRRRQTRFFVPTRLGCIQTRALHMHAARARRNFRSTARAAATGHITYSVGVAICFIRREREETETGLSFVRRRVQCFFFLAYPPAIRVRSRKKTFFKIHFVRTKHKVRARRVTLHRKGRRAHLPAVNVFARRLSW